jgi:thioredoxin 1
MDIQSIDESEIKTVVQDEDKPVVLDIWMDDCPPCNMLAPKLKVVAHDYEEQVSVYKVRVENDSSVFDQFDIETIPAILFFKDGKLKSRLEGLIHSNELDQQFESLINDDT